MFKKLFAQDYLRANPSRGLGSLPPRPQGGLVQQVIADRQRVLDSFTPNPYDQYQYLMENPATRQAPTDDEVITGGFMPARPTDDEVITGGFMPATPTDPNEGRLSFDDFRSMRNQEPMVSIMPVETPPMPDTEFLPEIGPPEIIPQIPSPATSYGFLSSILSSDSVQKAIDDYKASMSGQSAAMDTPPVTPSLPEDLQDRIRALTGGSGMMGGMIPNIDLDRLRAVMADLYGGQTPQQRFEAVERPRPMQIMRGRRGDRGFQ